MSLLVLAVALPMTGSASAQAKEARSAGVTRMHLIVEPYQAAFYLLIPEGWRTEGGMRPSGVAWNKLDLVESNIGFRATSPDGQSRFGWYPRFYFVDPAVYVRSSGGILHPALGSVMDGAWVYPAMGVADFARQIVFGRIARQELGRARLVGHFVEVPALRKLAPQVATQVQAGYVDFELEEGGKPMRGRLYTTLFTLGDSGLWSNIGTAAWIAPASRVREDSRLMEYSLRTFRLNPEWVKQATAAEIKRGAEMARVTRDINEADRRWQAERLARSSETQTEFYKVLTGQIETRDPETGKESWLPAYKHAFTDGRGNYAVTDNDSAAAQLQSGSDWRPLRIIDRNAR
ncbi:MAG: hypothetical protein B7Y41_14850 [Hydrogenophilales bacterium 28-61-23]|nr:MAG: hypothetical protein B7Y41_14850 [Hydrogenophilales bacterium 28-61-23]